MMILCQRSDGLWFMAQRIRPELKGVALRTGNLMPRDSNAISIPPVHIVWSSYTEDLDELFAFPILKHDSMVVFPEAWSSESPEPILRVWTSQQFFERPVRTTQEYLTRMTELRAKGWAWDEREGGTKWLHIDELEMVEGPIPEGTF